MDTVVKLISFNFTTVSIHRINVSLLSEPGLSAIHGVIISVIIE